MGRPRKHNKHLPRGMIQRHGAYYLVSGGKWTRLDAEYGPALMRYAALIGEKPAIRTVGEAIAHYIQSSVERLAEATVKNYRHSAERLAPVLGHVGLAALQPSDVYRYLTTHGNVSANRDRALLSVAYTHARRIGAYRGDDPTKALNYRNEESARDRYVSDDELDTLLTASSPKIACIARFIELTGMRQSDALRVRVEDIDDGEAGGVSYTPGKQRKGKPRKRMLVAWSDELRECVAEARRLGRQEGREWLFESKPRGKNAKRGVGPYTPSGLRAMWRREREKAGITDVTLHDLRRKSGSDAASDAEAQDRLGHADPKVTRKHYRAKPKTVKPTR